MFAHHLRPFVVVPLVAPDVKHVVQHRRAPQHLAPGPVAPLWIFFFHQVQLFSEIKKLFIYEKYILYNYTSAKLYIQYEKIIVFIWNNYLTSAKLYIQYEKELFSSGTVIGDLFFYLAH